MTEEKIVYCEATLTEGGDCHTPYEDDHDEARGFRCPNREAHRSGQVLILGTRDGRMDGVWALGDTREEAERKFTEDGGGLQFRHILVTYNKDATFYSVDEGGFYSWQGPGRPTVENVEAS